MNIRDTTSPTYTYGYSNIHTMPNDLFNSLIGDIQSGNTESVECKIADLTDEQLDALFKEAQPYKALGTASTSKTVIGSVSNLREKYLKKLITTAMVGFLFQMKDEFSIDDGDLKTPVDKDQFMIDIDHAANLPESYNETFLYNEELLSAFKEAFPDLEITKYSEIEEKLSEDQLMEVSAKANARYAELTKKEQTLDTNAYNEALEKAVEEQSVEERKIINRFLEWLFKHDEDIHAEKGDNDIVGDPERKPLESLKGSNPVYDNVPPNDTHCRFNSYYDINYEKMREATKNIYNVKPDLEHAMIVYDICDTQKEVDAFVHKYGSTSKYDIVTFPLNQWTLMGPFKENRERVDYYNKNNAIIKNMLEQQEKDAALGEDLMKKRIKSKKIKAEKVFGKDSPQFEEYRKMSPSELEQKYGAKIEEDTDEYIKVSRTAVVDADTGRELNLDEDGVPENALEVPITSINAATGATNQTRIFTESSN